MVSTVTSNGNGNSHESKLGKTSAHPLDPLSQSEIRQVVAAVRAFMDKGGYAGYPAKALFNSVALREPPKYDLLNWSGLFSTKEIVAASSTTPQQVKRQADVSHCPPSVSLTVGPIRLQRLVPEL